MKTDTVFKRAFNDALDLISQLERRRAAAVREHAGRAAAGQPHDRAQGAVRAAREQGVVSGGGRRRGVVGRAIERRSGFPRPKPCRSSAQVEKRFMEWMLRDNARPGHRDQRARAGASVRRGDHRHPRVPQPLPALRADREAAERRLGVQGIHDQLRARALRDPRDVRAALGAGLRERCPTSSPLWRQIEALREEHLTLLDDIEERFHDFSDLDSRFHRLDQLGRAQPLHRRLLRHHHAHLPLPLSVEQARRAAAQRGRDPRAPHLHRGAAEPERVDHRARLPRAPDLGKADAHPRDFNHLVVTPSRRPAAGPRRTAAGRRGTAAPRARG